MGKTYLLCELVRFTLKGIWVAPTLFSRVPTGTEDSISPPGLLMTRAGQEEIRADLCIWNTDWEVHVCIAYSWGVMQVSLRPA